MNNYWRVLRATLRSAVWRTTDAGGSVPVSVPIIWALIAALAEIAHQYFESADSIFYSVYGLNSILAGLAIVAAVFALFAPGERALVVSVVLASNALWFVLAVGASLLARRVDWPDWSLAVWTRADTVILQVLLTSIWWLGATAALFRSIDTYRGTVMSAAAACMVSAAAVLLLPSLPMFARTDFDYRTANLWELGKSKLVGTARAEPSLKIDMEKLELSQGALLDDDVRRLLPERKGAADIYAIGVAGWSEQNVFVRELNGALAKLEDTIGMDRGAIRLVNHAETIERSPVASRSNFASAVHYVAGIMNREEDILLIFITSHGGPTGVGLVLGDAMQAILTPDDVASVLAREGIKNRIVIVSACYSGVFIKPLATPESIVITAADADNPSFGCANEREWTYFGDAFFNHALRSGVSLEEAFGDAKVTISQWEARDDVPPSNPQAHFGASLAAKLSSRIDHAPRGQPVNESIGRRASADAAPPD
jgi:Peptidase C13 family